MTQAQLFTGGNAAKPAKPRKVNAGEADFAHQCRARHLPPFEQQYQYAKCMGRKYSADFCFVDYKIIVEISGGVWMGGRGAHSMPTNIERDYEKHQYAARLGFYVMPFLPKDVRSGHAIEWTIETLYKHGWRPQLQL